MVLSKSDTTGEISYKRVVNTFIRQTQAIYKVTFEDGTILETTWNHPFRRLKLDATLLGGLQESSEANQSMDESEWTQAKDLKSGDLTFTADGKLLAISSIEVDGREETVYNFEVEDFHTYFVGESGVWVHNENYAAIYFRLKHPIVSNTATHLHDIYHNISSEIYGISGHQDSHNFTEANAFKHAAVMAELTQEYSAEIAERLGDAHESGERNERDRLMDQHNNALGRHIGQLQTEGRALNRNEIAQVTFYAVQKGYAWIEHPQGDRMRAVVDPNYDVQPSLPIKNFRTLTAEEGLKGFQNSYTEHVRKTQELQRLNTRMDNDTHLWRQAPVPPTWRPMP